MGKVGRVLRESLGIRLYQRERDVVEARAHHLPCM